MHNAWINRESNPKCILFFNGWGMDENAVKHLDSSGYDICMFNNYINLEGMTAEYKGYDEIYVIAWSLGVWAASRVLKETGVKAVRKIAINGTELPVDDEFGIPEEVFLGTLTGWDERNRDKFNLRMMGGRESLRKFSSMLPERDPGDQKDELSSIFIKAGEKRNSFLDWDAAVIGKGDMIFTARNQKKWWNGKARIIEKDMPHFPFTLFRSWKSIIEV